MRRLTLSTGDRLVDLAAPVASPRGRASSRERRRIWPEGTVLVSATLGLLSAAAFANEPITYAVKITAPATHVAEVEATFPTQGRGVIELMMPVWSPGFYRVEDYASRVEDLSARSVETKRPLIVERPQKNRWRIQAQGALHV